MTLSVHVKKVRLHPGAIDGIKEHARAENDKGHYEAVGFVMTRGDGEGVAIMPLHNHSPDPQHGYFVEPWEQFRAEKKIHEDGYTILGVYHSHTNSEALPSQFDHQLCRRSEFAFIYSVVFDDLRAYYEHDGSLIPAEII